MNDSILLPPYKSRKREKFMLKYHHFIWNTFSNHPDGLYILGKGLDAFEIEKQLIIECSKAHQLIFVFGISENDKQRIIWESANSGVEFLPKDIEKAIERKERSIHYNSNTIYFHSPGVLAKDILKGIIDPKKISGIIIHNAEVILKDPGLQLCLACYRSSNQSGYIKAFSEKISEIGDLKKISDLLWVRYILLFPRFETNVKESIKSCDIQIVDISLKSPNQNKMKIDPESGNPDKSSEVTEFVPIISNNLVKIFDLLKSLHASFMSEYGKMINLTAEQSLTYHPKYLEKLICGQNHSSPSSPIKSPKATLKSLSSMNPNPDKTSSTNNLSEEQQQKILESVLFFRRSFFILLHEDSNVFNDYLQTIHSRNNGPYHPLWFEFPQAASLFKVSLKYADENIPNPKLQWIVNLITTIPRDKRVLILAEGTGTVTMICNFLAGFTPRTAGGGIQIPLTSVVVNEENGNENSNETVLDEELLIDPEIFGIIQPPMILLQELHAQADVLEKFQPDIVIFWDVTVLSLRRLEVFNSRYQKNVICYLLSYPDAKEMEAMQNSIDHENNLFVQSIRSLQTLVLNDLIPIKQGTRSIIVDDREFRSFLPLALLKAGFKVVVQHLIVGDYVLSDDIVVERKAYNDLVMSLNSGRLLQQLQRMKQYYANQFLLIEFTDVNEQFNAISAKGKSPAIMNKLMTIMLNFPEVKILWARNSIEAGRTLWALSYGKQQPEVAKAVEMGGRNREIGEEDSRQIKFLSSIPFLSSQQILAIIENCKSLRELALMSRDKMMTIIDPVIGLKLYSLLHAKIKQVS